LQVVQLASSGQRGQIVVDELVADGATLAFASDEPNRNSLRFSFQRLRLAKLGRNTQIGFSTVLVNPHPPGLLSASGHLGPFPSGQRGRTPVSGSFELTGTNLGEYDGLSGTLNGKGNFRGALESIQIEGDSSL
jgi:hypothetical protein